MTADRVIPASTRALVCFEPGRYRLETRPVPAVGPGEALLRMKACGVCSGELMPWYVRDKLPKVMGHEPAGEIVAVGKDVESFAPGDRVFVHHHAPCGSCRHCRRGHPVHCETWRRSRLDPGGMAELIRVPAQILSADTLRLPPHVDFEDGTLIEPLACVVKALRRAALADDERVVILGLGVMGALALRLVLARSAKPVIVVDRVPFRLEKALALGAHAALNVDETDPETGVRDLTDGQGADLVFVAPPAVEAMESGLRLAGPGGRVLLFSPTPPDTPLTLRPHAIYFREVSLIPSYSCGPEDTRQALEHIARGEVRACHVVTHRYPLERAGEAYSLAESARDSLKVLVVDGAEA